MVKGKIIEASGRRPVPRNTTVIFRTAHHQVLAHISKNNVRNQTNHISYNRALEITECEGMKTTMRTINVCRRER